MKKYVILYFTITLPNCIKKKARVTITIHVWYFIMKRITVHLIGLALFFGYEFHSLKSPRKLFTNGTYQHIELILLPEKAIITYWKRYLQDAWYLRRFCCKPRSRIFLNLFRISQLSTFSHGKCCIRWYPSVALPYLLIPSQTLLPFHAHLAQVLLKPFTQIKCS